MNKFETLQEQPKTNLERIEETKERLESLLNNPEENKEEILELTDELEELNNSFEKEIEEATEKISFYRKNPEEIRSESYPYFLRKLSEYSNKSVRIYIARNPNIPLEILEKLSQEKILM